jgi:nitrate reductase (NAD(P)H)
VGLFACTLLSSLLICRPPHRGLTPHWQLIHAILKTKSDNTRISMIDSNSLFSDVLLYDELIGYAKEHSDQLKLWFTLSHKPEDREWPYSEGHLDEKMMREHFFAADGDKVGTFLCGPSGLIEKAAIPALKTMGFKEGMTMFGF